MTEWKNKDCPLFNCEDRKYQRELEQKLEVLQKQRDDLYKNMQEIENILAQKEENTQQIIESLLQKAKVTKEGKSIDLKEIQEMLSDKQSEVSSASVIQKKLQLQREKHNLTTQVTMLKEENVVFKEQIEQLDKERRINEEKDIRLIKDANEAKARNDSLMGKNQSLEFEIKKKQNYINAMKSDINELRENIKALSNQHETTARQWYDLNQEILIMRLVYAHYEQYTTIRARWIKYLIKRAIKQYRRGKYDLARTKMGKIDIMYDKLSEPEKYMVRKEYCKLQECFEGENAVKTAMY